MKKYLKYAKQRIKPQLGEKARDAIQEAWVELR